MSGRPRQPELHGHTSREHYLTPKSATVIFPFNNDPLQILMQWGGVFPDYFTNLRAGGGMMKEFARRLDEDGRTSHNTRPLSSMMIGTANTSTKRNRWC
jgi:hypothetical protein